MASFHLFPLLPTELRLKIWEMTVEPRLILFEYNFGAREHLPDPQTPTPAVLHACRESRAALADVRLYTRAFQTDEDSRYHWISFAADVFVVDFPDLQTIGRPETRLMRNLRVEVGAGGDHHEPDEWDGALAALSQSFPEVCRLDMLVDEPLHEWAYVFAEWHQAMPCAPGGFRIIEVREGRWLSEENRDDYRDWYCMHEDLGCLGMSDREDPEGQYYTSEVCPAGVIEGWEFPPVPSMNWEEY